MFLPSLSPSSFLTTPGKSIIPRPGLNRGPCPSWLCVGDCDWKMPTRKSATARQLSGNSDRHIDSPGFTAYCRDMDGPLPIERTELAPLPSRPHVSMAWITPNRSDQQVNGVQGLKPVDLGGEQIAGAIDGLDQTRRLGVAFDLFTDARDAHVDGTVIGKVVTFAVGPLQLFARQHPFR